MFETYTPQATMYDAHAEWHLNSGVPMGTAGCPQDACHPVEEVEPEIESPRGDGVKCGHCGGRHFSLDDLTHCARSDYRSKGVLTSF